MDERCTRAGRALLPFLGAVAALGVPAPVAAAQAPVVEPFGFYTDRPSYAPGEVVTLRANWEPALPGGTVRAKYRLHRFGPAGPVQVGAETQVFLHRGDQALTFGSFVEYPPELSLAGRFAFTLEGWVQPTLIGDGAGDDDDWVAVAGELGCPTCATWQPGQPFPIQGTAGLGITAEGFPFVYAETDVTGRTWLVGDERLLVRDPGGELHWTYLAATYDGSRLRLLVGDAAGWIEVKTAPLRGRLVAAGLPFRLGARTEAPADLAGVLDGRLDDWAVWGVGLPPALLELRRAATGGGQRASAAGAGLFARVGFPLEMSADFEDPYGTSVADGSGHGRHGLIRGHGTPGVAGHGGEGQALRLNHDQVVDAGWTPLAVKESGGGLASIQLTVPAGAKSGLYAVQALLDDGAGFDPANREQVRWQSLVVRPAPGGPRAPVGVVVPVNTWMAYNGWPGDGLGSGTAFGMTRLGGFRQGNNSAYGRMGDGLSPPYFVGWRRPNFQASPFDAPGRSSPLGPMVRTFIEWLESRGGEGIGPKIPYDVYCDWDLGDGTLDPADHVVLVTVAHQEYWSNGMLLALRAFTDGDPLATPPIPAGGSLINLAGNVFTFRVEVVRSTGAMEVKKWPSVTEFTGLMDKVSLVAGGLMGELPYAQRCSMPPRTDYELLGTLRDIVVPCDVTPACFGTWKVTSTSHWLWEDPVVLNERLAPDTVGHEFDAFVASHPPPGSNVEILAVGTDFSGVSPARALDWNHVSFQADCSELDAEAQGNPSNPYWASRTSAVQPSSEHGSLLTYDHRGGGRVLSLASTRAPVALRDTPKLSRLVYKAFRCFALGIDCP